jgi:serine/threonine protein kinase
MIGRKLAHYEIIEKIGAGGMGEVYRARDTKLDRDVALKTLAPDVATIAEQRRRFERETKAIAALNHPNIVTIYSVEEADSLVFYTMELIDGPTLNEIIPSDGLPLDRLFAIAIPVADAVSRAHAQGITHRDLKPGNIMLDQDGRPKVLDFGLAKLTARRDPREEATILADDDHTVEGRILGTVFYMSPEQAESRVLDHRSDIFSLGVVLYEAATGTRPFRGDTKVSVLSSILRETPQPVTDCRRDLPRHLDRIKPRPLGVVDDSCLRSTGEHCAASGFVVGSSSPRSCSSRGRPPLCRSPM